jgi:hypothetical protein
MSIFYKPYPFEKYFSKWADDLKFGASTRALTKADGVFQAIKK